MKNTEIQAQTQAQIIEALFTLMRQKDYASVTVKEIAEQAGFGRATVYRYFQSKEDMIRCYFRSHASAFQNVSAIRVDSPEDYYEIIFRVFSILRENKETVKLLIQARLEVLYLEFINESMCENFMSHDYPEQEYLPYYFAGSLFNVSMHWVKNDCRDSVKHISDLFYHQLFHVFHTFKKES